ncbi:MAG: HD domain-containing protein [Candidatus Zixiibacteriota bacterium]
MAANESPNGTQSQHQVESSSEARPEQHGVSTEAGPLTPVRDLTKNPKFIRDPIHDLIQIDDQMVLNVLSTEPIQRLKYIRQLGVAFFVYPGADHSRFSHSLGVYHLARRVLNQIHEDDSERRKIIQLAALLHDTGHGPFSHLFEAALKEVKYAHFEKHEKWTNRIVMEHPQVLQVLGESMCGHVRDVIAGFYKPQYLGSIVNSQLDVDRFDYMLRDSHMTGVHYGKFDLTWMLRNLSRQSYEELDADGEKVPVDKIVIDGRRGLGSLETYLLGNFYLYAHVYYHKTVQAAEGMLVKILRRAIDCAKEDAKRTFLPSVLAKIGANEKLELDEYLQLNDFVVLTWIHEWGKKEIDTILQDLCRRFLQRKLFKARLVTDLGGREYADKRDEVKNLLSAKGFDPHYYLVEAEPTRLAYKDFFFLKGAGKALDEVYFVDSDGRVKPFSSISKYEVSKAIRDVTLDEKFFIVPDEIEL